MQDFLWRFFPNVAAKAADKKSHDPYCTYADVGLQLFTSSLFLAAAFAGLAGSTSTRCSSVQSGTIKTKSSPRECLVCRHLVMVRCRKGVL